VHQVVNIIVLAVFLLQRSNMAARKRISLTQSQSEEFTLPRVLLVQYLSLIISRMKTIPLSYFEFSIKTIRICACCAEKVLALPRLSNTDHMSCIFSEQVNWGALYIKIRIFSATLWVVSYLPSEHRETRLNKSPRLMVG
jgi:hypothetical protein